MALLINADKALLRLAAEPYDETVVELIRTLPQRRYRPESHDWCIPARREHLRAVCGLIAELDEQGIPVQVARAADVRLTRVDTGRAVLRDGVIEIAGPYSQRRLPALRALPERRFDAERKLWTVPLTRAGSLALLALTDNSDELVITRRARRALQRSAAASTSAENGGRPPSVRTTSRRSPVAHWRHYTAGPVFDNPARPHVDVPGIGVCVRIRVDPSRPRPQAASSRRDDGSGLNLHRSRGALR